MTARPLVRTLVRALLRGVVYANAPFVPINAETVAYVATISPTPSDALVKVIDDGISALKAAGAWTLIDQGGFPALTLANIKAPGTNNIVSTGTDAGDYIQTNGSSTFLTLINPGAGGFNYTQNAAFFACRRLNVDLAAVRGNGWFDGTDGTGITERGAGDLIAYRINSALSSAGPAGAALTGDAFIAANRSGASATQCYVDGVQQTDTNGNRTSSAVNNNVLYLGRGASAEYFAGRYFSVFVGGNLSAAQHAVLASFERSVLSALGIDLYTMRSGPKTLLSARTLPDTISGRGACTGLFKDRTRPDFLVCYDGRSNEADVTYDPSIIRIPMTGDAVKLEEHVMKDAYPSMTSLQGGVEDIDGTWWLGSLGAGRVEHYDPVTRTDIGDGFALAGVNGIALDVVNRKLFTSTAAAIQSRNMDGSGAVTIASGLSNTDHLFFSPEQNRLYFTSGANGVPVICDVFDVSNNEVKRRYSFDTALAGEGIYVDVFTGRAHVIHDGEFHAAGNLLNQIQVYQL